jgi:uncharacterized protein YihD (DUF1040 family)
MQELTGKKTKRAVEYELDSFKQVTNELLEQVTKQFPKDLDMAFIRFRDGIKNEIAVSKKLSTKYDAAVIYSAPVEEIKTRPAKLPGTLRPAKITPSRAREIFMEQAIATMKRHKKRLTPRYVKETEQSQKILFRKAEFLHLADDEGRNVLVVITRRNAYGPGTVNWFGWYYYDDNLPASFGTPLEKYILGWIKENFKGRLQTKGRTAFPESQRDCRKWGLKPEMLVVYKIK